MFKLLIALVFVITVAIILAFGVISLGYAVCFAPSGKRMEKINAAMAGTANRIKNIRK